MISIPESGVRGLEKQIAKSVRYAAKSVAMDEKYSLNPSKEEIKDILGPQLINREVFKNNNKAGLLLGLLGLLQVEKFCLLNRPYHLVKVNFQSQAILEK